MIVDCHTHAGRYEHFSETFHREIAIARGDDTPVMDIDFDDHLSACEPVDRAVVLAFEAPHSGIDVPNDYVAEYVKRAPEKFIGFCSVDVTDPDPAAEVERCVGDLGLRGVKLGPVYQGYHPMDHRILPVYERAQRLGVPVLIHQGTTFPRRAPLKYAHPILLEDVALGFPDLKIVIAHLGHPWEADTIVLIRKQPNVYSDVSGLWYRPWQFYNSMMLAWEYGVTHKLLFGTDYPFTRADETLHKLRHMCDFLEGTRLPRVPAEAIEDIIHRDTLTLLGIE